jgi:hypothetical protein
MKELSVALALRRKNALIALAEPKGLSDNAQNDDSCGSSIIE